MDRCSWAHPSSIRPEPHARGDGPSNGQEPADPIPRAPRTWGWTVHPGEQHTESLPSPTHVGMDRGPAPEVGPAIPEPHARGDGPTNFAEQMGTRVRAPRTWGWTAVTMHAHRQRV